MDKDRMANRLERIEEIKALGWSYDELISDIAVLEEIITVLERLIKLKEEHIETMEERIKIRDEIAQMAVEEDRQRRKNEKLTDLALQLCVGIGGGLLLILVIAAVKGGFGG